jgi:periplasmic protein TonB
MELKKNPEVDLTKQEGFFFKIGLAASLLLCIIIFEWKTYDALSLANLGSVRDDFEEIIEIPQTDHLPPPPPVIQQPEIVEVPDEKEIEQVEVNLNVEVNEETKVEVVQQVTQAVEEEEVDMIFTVVEEQASPVGGMPAFYEYLRKNINYPELAKKMGIEGKVFVEFVIDKNGKPFDVKVMRGIGGGCDEEAVRVVKAMPAWNPGKQRGRPVKSKMVVPISFKIG